jgi:hypothetical protein
MSEERLEPIDAELDALLDAERRARPPSATLDRVWARVGGALAVADAPHALGKGWLASHPVGLAAVALLVGGAGGAALHASLARPPPERIIQVYVPLPAPAPPVPSATTQQAVDPAPVLPASSEGPAAPQPRASGSAPVASSTLSAERVLLDGARAALTAGEPARALSMLSEHARRFPRPQLGEEREALTIQALAAAGRYDEARTRAVRFRASAPNSLFLPAVDATLASIP